MFISKKTYKFIEHFATKKSISVNNLSKEFNHFKDDELENLIEHLTKNKVLYFWFVDTHQAYDLTDVGRKIHKDGFLMHNLKQTWIVLNDNKSWLSIVIALISLSISIKKC